MPDIAMCANNNCYMSSKCYRHADSGSEPSTPYQAYMSFEPRQETGKNFVCDGLWLRVSKKPLVVNWGGIRE